jgi:hypothetical protein
LHHSLWLGEDFAMLRRCALLLFAFVFASPGRSQPPEQLLPAGTQLYARWDGVDAHRFAYGKTALGKILLGDTGNFLASLVNQFQDLSSAALTSEQLLQGVPPEQLRQLQADAAETPMLFSLLGRHGVIVALEARSLEPPSAQLLIIVPDAGPNPGPLFGSIRLVSGLAKAPVQERKVGGRSVHDIAAGPIHVGWWVEGKHAVVAVGTDSPELVIQRMHGSGPRLTEHPLFKQVQAFKDFETGARAFIDLAALARLARSRGKAAAQLVSDLGLEGLQSWTFYSGFDGPAERSLSELTMTGPRRGLLRLVGGKPFRLTDLPPIPTDATSFSATNLDLGILYDAGLQAAERIVGLFSPEDVPKVRAATATADLFLGINLRKDLLGSLDDRFMQYASPAEGPFFFGQTLLFKVKDPAKLQTSLTQAVKSAGRLAGGNVTLKKSTYRGVVLHEVHVRQQGFPFLPTFAIHNNWLIVSAFPQPIEGFILRVSGELPGWKPGTRLQKTLTQLPQEFVSISISDPRPTIRQLLSVAPMLGGTIKSLAPDTRFSVDSIPNAHEVTKHLFPNVSVVTDTGEKLRNETRASLILPVDLGGLDASYLPLLAVPIFQLFANQ